MKPYFKLLFVVICLLGSRNISAQATDSIKVMFIYGSKPAHGFENEEHRWFGGKRGGHVALQIGPDKVLSFRSTKYNPCHIFAASKPANYASVYEIKTVHGAWETFPPHNYNIDSVQRAEVVIPITAAQRAVLDSVVVQYIQSPPYDYAFFGLRCASSSYDVLGRIGVLPWHKHFKWLRIFTPRSLRTMLFKKTDENKNKGWVRHFYKGYKKRAWERDKYS